MKKCVERKERNRIEKKNEHTRLVYVFAVTRGDDDDKIIVLPTNNIFSWWIASLWGWLSTVSSGKKH
jgi:hypothetical protein